jgi:hypothetical protein
MQIVMFEKECLNCLLDGEARPCSIWKTLQLESVVVRGKLCIHPHLWLLACWCTDGGCEDDGYC